MLGYDRTNFQGGDVPGFCGTATASADYPNLVCAQAGRPAAQIGIILAGNRAFASDSKGCGPELRERDMNDRNGYAARPHGQTLIDRNQPLPGTCAAGPEYSLITDGQAQSLSSTDMLTGLDCCTAASGASV